MTEKSSNQNAATFSSNEDDVFGRIASQYDLLCDIFSLGIHRLWKRQVAHYIIHQKWDTLIDAASGTGDIILRLIKHQHYQERTIIGSDISVKMLEVAQKRLLSYKNNVSFQLLNAERMPSIQSNSVDAYSISLGLKICNRHLVLQEAFRILKPGGTLIILESSNIPIKSLNGFYLSYMSICMPILGWLATLGDASAYQYLLRGIRKFPSAEQLVQEIKSHGFENCSFKRLSLGIVAIHTASKPLE